MVGMWEPDRSPDILESAQLGHNVADGLSPLALPCTRCACGRTKALDAWDLRNWASFFPDRTLNHRRVNVGRVRRGKAVYEDVL